MDISNGSVLSFAIIGGIFGTCWSYIKLFFDKLRSIFIIHARFRSNGLYSVKSYMTYLEDKKLISSKVNNNFNCYDYMYGTKNLKKIPIPLSDNMGGQYKLIWFGWSPILLQYIHSNKDENDFTTLEFFFFRYTFNVEDFFLKAVDYYHYTTSQKNRFSVVKIFGRNKKDNYLNKAETYETIRNTPESISYLSSYRFLKHNKEEFFLSNNAFSNYFFSKSVLELIKEIELRFNSDDWFHKMNIPSKLGVLLYGEPGSGKSSLVKNIAMKLDVPIYFFDLNTLSNDELSEGWKSMQTPCIALFEDIDAVFNKRENINKTDLTFDCLLNCISGVDDQNGIYTFITTNDITKIDEALGIVNDEGVSTRPGRIDRILYLGKTTDEMRKQMANHLLKSCSEFIDVVVKEGENDMPAQFNDRCLKIALEQYNKTILKKI